MYDIFDSGTPKYSTAADIYEKLCEIYYNEEASIIGEMFPDVSYDNQDYYYTDKGTKLKEQFDAVSDFGNNMWIMDLAVSRLKASESEYPCLDDLNDIVFQAANNEDLAKRISFKPLFVKYMLFDNPKLYKKYLGEFEEELREVDYFNWHINFTAWQKVINANGFRTYHNGYREFSNELHKKILNLHLQDEMVVIAECQTFLNSYDDFIRGLTINQILYKGLENSFNAKLSQLQASYKEQVKLLYAVAASQGVQINLNNGLNLLEAGNDTEDKIWVSDDFRFTGKQNGVEGGENCGEVV